MLSIVNHIDLDSNRHRKKFLQSVRCSKNQITFIQVLKFSYGVLRFNESRISYNDSLAIEALLHHSIRDLHEYVMFRKRRWISNYRSLLHHVLSAHLKREMDCEGIDWIENRRMPFSTDRLPTLSLPRQWRRARIKLRCDIYRIREAIQANDVHSQLLNTIQVQKRCSYTTLQG